eukprot:1907577-Rhodomonas_salina.1
MGRYGEGGGGGGRCVGKADVSHCCCRVMGSSEKETKKEEKKEGAQTLPAPPFSPPPRIYAVFCFSSILALEKAPSNLSPAAAAGKRELKDRPNEVLEFRDYTRELLAQYNGTVMGKPLLVAILGKVYDVTAGADFYGPGPRSPLPLPFPLPLPLCPPSLSSLPSLSGAVPGVGCGRGAGRSGGGRRGLSSELTCCGRASA